MYSFFNVIDLEIFSYKIYCFLNLEGAFLLLLIYIYLIYKNLVNNQLNDLTKHKKIITNKFFLNLIKFYIKFKDNSQMVIEKQSTSLDFSYQTFFIHTQIKTIDKSFNFQVLYNYILLLLSLYLYTNQYVYVISDQLFVLSSQSTIFNGDYNLLNLFQSFNLKIQSFALPFLFLLHIINFLTLFVYKFGNNIKKEFFVLMNFEKQNFFKPIDKFYMKNQCTTVFDIYSGRNQPAFQNSLFFLTIVHKNFVLSKTNKFLFFIFLLLSLQIILFIFFTCTDLVPFYITFEASMIPLFIIIFLYGKRIERINAAYYLFFYTLIGSILFLIGIAYLIIQEGTSSLIALNFLTLSPNIQITAFLLFFIAFAVKLPMMPFHLWLPEAHVEASTEGSVLLAALLLKISAYGIITVLFKLLPVGSLYFKPLILSFALLSFLLICGSMFRQLDLKKIIAYTSVAHMNLGLLGLFTFNLEGFYGAYSLMIVHGFVSSGLFILIGYLYNRFHTRALFYYSGLNIYLPRWSLMFFVFTLANCGFPFTAAFVPEMLIFFSLFNSHIYIGFFALIGAFLIVIASFLTFLRLTTGIPSKRTGGLLHLPMYNFTEFATTIKQITSVKHYMYFERDLTTAEFELAFGLMFFITVLFFFPQILFNIPMIKILQLLYALNL